jgi:hypothetical protein
MVYLPFGRRSREVFIVVIKASRCCASAMVMAAWGSIVRRPGVAIACQHLVTLIHRDAPEVHPHLRVVGIVPYQTTGGVK